MNNLIKPLDIDDFPVGVKVITPTGRLGTVTGYRGCASKHDNFERVIVRYDSRNKKDTVALLPSLLAVQDKNPAAPVNAEIITISKPVNKNREK